MKSHIVLVVLFFDSFFFPICVKYRHPPTVVSALSEINQLKKNIYIVGQNLYLLNAFSQYLTIVVRFEDNYTSNIVSCTNNCYKK